MTYALDTNTISFILNDNADIIKKFNDTLDSGNFVKIPLMTYYEARRGLVSNNASKKLKSFNKLCSMLGVDNLSISDMNAAADIYAELKKAGKPIEDSDIIIGAYCLTRGYTLITDNKRHFERIDNLQYINWVE